MAAPFLKHSAIAIGLIAAGLVSCEKQDSAIGKSPVVTEAAATEIPETVTFNAHIRPIFSDKCFSCHGFDKTTRKAKLRLDTQEGAYAALADDETKQAIVPGNAQASDVWQRITSKDPDVIMPVPEFHKPLTEREISLITKWIDQGAKYQQHWSFAALEKPPVPTVIANAKQVANPIDSFVFSNLEKEKLETSPVADKATLLRRLSLDLIGLPPTVEELDNFLNDASPEAYSKQVERLLSSPHYGERMAVPWLDVVRFADTVGYHGDQNLRVFPYRDYVIKAFNDNKPFDQFTIEQLAGDLLPGAPDEQRIATGFLRLNLVTREGGAQAKEYLAKSMGDRVRAVGAAWLGLTTGCAECHDHKFDPITAKDFYSLGAFFADVRQWGVYADYRYTPNSDLKGVDNNSPFPPEIQALNPALLQRMNFLRESAAEVLSKTPIDDTFAKWIEDSATFLKVNPTGWRPLTASEITTQLATPFKVHSDRSILFTGEPRKDELVTLTFPLGPGSVSAFRIEALPDAENAGKVGRQSTGKFSMTPKFLVDSQELKIAYAQADRRTPLKYNNGDHDPKLEAEWRSAPAMWEEPQDAAAKPHTAIYQLVKSIEGRADQVLTVTIASADVGRIRISVTPFGDPIAGQENALSDSLKAALNSANSGQNSVQIAGWARAKLSESKLPKDYIALRERIIDCRAGYAHSVVAQAVPPDQMLVTKLLPRGDWTLSGEEVKPAVPDFLPHASLPESERLNRLDLAKWLVSRENPLTARQFTNRLWKQFFGKGLSNVLDDLGNQGEWPSNPELLDWLASEFRDGGWDVKKIVRLIVNSHTYRQQSITEPELAERDPGNRLLAAQSPRRLDAEFVRDNALAISGMLAGDWIGGPSVKPYQPEGYYANLNFPGRGYPASMGDEQYRRGLYMHWQRTFTHPMLAGFDAPSREECSADRLQSNSPQQALILLNDPSFLEAARAFASSLLIEKSNTSDQEKIRHAIRRALSREPKEGEVESLELFLKQQRSNVKAKLDDPAKMLEIGYFIPPANVDPDELAAWTQTCRVLLNLHETLTRY